MAYRVFLVEQLGDEANHVELDVEDVDFATVFNVAEVADISLRKGNITKQIAFKGTARNNTAFGNLLHSNKRTDFAIKNNIGFNYNALRTVDCLIYEDNQLLLQGSIRVIGTKYDRNGTIIYNTVITGAELEYRMKLANKHLHDIDLTDLKHQFTINNVLDSASVKTQRYDESSLTYSYVNFQKGSGYVYPEIDYGVWFKKESANKLSNKHISNYRPAVYVREIFDRIFNQEELNGYSYEIKGNDSLIQKFNSLILPNVVEKQGGRTDKRWRLRKTTSANVINELDSDYLWNGSKDWEFPISFQTGLVPGPLFSENYMNYYGTYRDGNISCVFEVERNFKCDALLNVTLTDIENNSNALAVGPFPVRVSVELCRRGWIATTEPEFNDADTWEVIASSSFSLLPNQNIASKNITLEIGEQEFQLGTQIMARVRFSSGIQLKGPIGSNNFEFKLTSAELAFPKDQTNGLIDFEAIYGDHIVPTLPENIKQMDFLKSVITMFNFYVYADKTRPKHLIFQTYDDYYAMTSLNLLPSTAINWSRKVVPLTVEKKTNLTIPKKYLFAYKEDGDEYNKQYKVVFNDTYGNFSFDDELGVTDQQKVEVIFSASPTVTYTGSDKLQPIMWVMDSGKPKPQKTNIRLLFYNGLRTCNPFNIGKDTYDGEWQMETLRQDVTVYAMCSEYYFLDGLTNFYPLGSLMFGNPRQYFFGVTDVYRNAPGVYQSYYQNQVSQMTDPNVLFVECDVMLNEIDIANLDLRVPVFIDEGAAGHGYYKVLSVEYVSKDTPSKVKLQKITV